MKTNEIIEKINQYSFNNDEKEIIDLLNDLLKDEKYKENLDLVFFCIKITQMYGFLSYLSAEEKKEFLNWDTVTSRTYLGENIEFYNSGQLSLVFEFEKKNKIFLSAPTSFGKTSLVIEYILKTYKITKNILFIVPTKSLLEELYIKFLKLNKKKELNYCISTQPIFLEHKNNLLILTPERFLLLNEKIDVNSFDLIVMDETYKILELKSKKISERLDSRAAKFRKVAEIIGKTTKKLFLLSPFTYCIKESMKRYLEKYGIEKIDRKIEYVKRKIILVVNSQRNEGNNSIYVQGRTIEKKTVNLLKILKRKKSIVYVRNYNTAYNIIDEIDESFKPNINDRYIKFIKYLESTYQIQGENEWKVITALKRGIGIYISPLPRFIKKEIITLYKENVLNTLLVTTSFTEGVNTDASNLIFTSLQIGDNKNRLTDIDVLNVIGRAGRFAEESIGYIYCINDKIYEKVEQLVFTNSIAIENSNYELKEELTDYEIDMVDDEYLSEKEKKIKKAILLEIEKCGLSRKDLNISLNVPTKWKIGLYQYLLNQGKEQLQIIYDACVNLLSNEKNKKIESLKIIFNHLNNYFKDTKIQIYEKYDEEEFSEEENRKIFSEWIREYELYSANDITIAIKSEIRRVQSIFKSLKQKYHFLREIKEKKEFFSNLPSKKYYNWMKKFYLDDLKIDINTFYSEGFKIISNTIQYKIPFFTSFFISIFKLVLIKNDLLNGVHLNLLDTKKITLLFEEGTDSEEYSQLIDYGFPVELIKKLNSNDIKVRNLINNDFPKYLFDNYELLLIDEIRRII